MKIRRTRLAGIVSAFIGTGIAFGCGGDEGSTIGPPPPPGAGAVTISAYLSGSDIDELRDVATDSQGNIYVTGGSVSADYPTTPGVVQPSHHPGPPVSSRIRDDHDVIVSKLDPSGRLVWSTFLGGPGHDRAYASEVDAHGFVYVAGRAGQGFPITPARRRGLPEVQIPRRTGRRTVSSAS